MAFRQYRRAPATLLGAVDFGMAAGVVPPMAEACVCAKEASTNAMLSALLSFSWTKEPGSMQKQPRFQEACLRRRDREISVGLGPLHRGCDGCCRRHG